MVELLRPGAARMASAVSALSDMGFNITVNLKSGEKPFFEEVSEKKLEIVCTKEMTFESFYAALCEQIGYPSFIEGPYWPPKLRKDNQPDLMPKYKDTKTLMTEFQGTEFELKIRALCNGCNGYTNQGNFVCNCCGGNKSPPGTYGIDRRTVKGAGYGCSPG